MKDEGKGGIGRRELLGRRQFLGRGIAAAVGLGALDLAGVARAAAAAEDAPNTHNMLVVGEQAVFLSHLPMFQRLDNSRSEFASPHRYQVILEAAFSRGEKVLSDLYVKDRREHPDTRIYTLGPEEFVLSRLFAGAAGAAAQSSFTGTLFRGHLENGGQPVAGLEDARVKVVRVVHARKFDPRAKRPERLEYILFGTPGELFLAHAIFGPPDFDQVVRVTLSGTELTEKDLAGDLRLVFSARKNAAAERLRESDKLQGILRPAAADGAAERKVEVQVARQFYFEEGELLVPPTFDPTPEEKKTGA